MTITTWLGTATVATALLTGGCGLMAPSGNEGYADFDSPGVFDTDLTTSFSIGPTLLHFAARHVEDDPEAEALLSGLDGVRVRIYTIDGETDKIAQRLDRMSAKLQEQQWQPVVQVREEHERTHVLMKLGEAGIDGIAVISSDGDEVVLVNVMGKLSPEMFSEAMAELGVEGPASWASISTPPAPAPAPTHEPGHI